MLKTTLEIIRSGLKADPSLSPADRTRVLSLLRNAQNSTKTATVTSTEPHLIRRIEVAHRLSCSLRTVDKLAAAGVLRKRKFPGRIRASGFLESDIVALLTGGAQ